MTLASSISRTLLLFAACGTAVAQYTAPLPNAPSATIQTMPAPFPSNLVNGRVYERPTRREDVRYLICHDCSAGDKLKNAVLAEFTARHGEDGHRTFSPTPIVAGMSGPLVAYSAWYPPGYDTSDAAKHAIFGFGFRIAGHILREFIADKD